MTFRYSGIPAVKNRTQIDYDIPAFRHSGREKPDMKFGHNHYDNDIPAFRHSGREKPGMKFRYNNYDNDIPAFRQ